MAWPNTPAAVPLYGTYNHWVVVNGASANKNPAPNPYVDSAFIPQDLTVYGMWLTDPSSNGIGQDIYVTAQAAQMMYFFPVVSADRHNGRFVQVGEPPLTESEVNVTIAEPQVNDQTHKVIEIAKETTKDIADNLPAYEKRLGSVKKHLYDAALAVNLRKDSKTNANMLFEKESSDLLNLVFEKNGQAPIELDWKRIVDSSLLTDKDFRKAFDGSQATSFEKVRQANKENSFYYLIPFDKYTKGEFLTYAAIIIDAKDGSFKVASWAQEPTRFIQVNKEKAIELVLSENPLLQGAELKAELTWEPGSVSQSPFYPYWSVSSRDEVYYVTQNGEVVKKK